MSWQRTIAVMAERLATAVHRSAECGKLEYDKPVCNYWPEFRVGGKEKRPVFADGAPQEFRLGSICVAGRNAAWVQRH